VRAEQLSLAFPLPQLAPSLRDGKAGEEGSLRSTQDWPCRGGRQGTAFAAGTQDPSPYKPP